MLDVPMSIVAFGTLGTLISTAPFGSMDTKDRSPSLLAQVSMKNNIHFGLDLLILRLTVFSNSIKNAEFVEWHVMDKPAKMSKAQHYQMKKLLFHHVDGKCRKTSVGHNGSVARPIQKMRDRDLYKCSCDNFLSDYQVIEEGRKNCGMVPGQKKDVAKSMDKNGKDDKPWTVKDDNWPGNGSDIKKYCGKCELTSKDRKWAEENDD